MKVDLTYTNKEGISLQNVLDVLTTSKSKKDIQTSLNTDKSIDTLIKKLEDASLIVKKKDGNKVLFESVQVTDIEKPKAKAIPKEKKPAAKKNKKAVESVEIVAQVEEPEIIPVEPEMNNDLSEIMDIKMPRTSDEFQEKIALTPIDPVTSISSAPKLTKARPKMTKAPAAVEAINKQTAIVSKDHQITALVEIEDKKEVHPKHREYSNEVNSDDLDALKKEMEGRTGKEVTAILHKRKDRALRTRKETAQEIYEKNKSIIEAEDEAYELDNPYKFILNFFTSTLNGEKATPYFRRRDDYVVKSIYNKFKTMGKLVEEYNLTPQSMPFYRVITINEVEMTVKIYHIDMNRIVRGVHTIFKLDTYDMSYLKFK